MSQTGITPYRVLVADDDSVSRKITVLMLEKRGYSVSAVENGRKVLAVLEESRFDIVLMDILMPELDGFETTKLIRDREKLTGEHIAILAMTAQAQRGDEQRCLAAGMDGYLSKPIEMAKLLVAVESALREGR
jgi:two-component system sensor histidine kinase/response regulator